MTLKPEPFNTINATTGYCNAKSHPASTCAWQLQDYGYNPYSLDPNGSGLWNTDASGNYGGYASPKMDALINATEYGSSPTAFFAYEDYAAQQLPVLWIPDESGDLHLQEDPGRGVPVESVLAALNPEVWYFTKSAK